MRAKGVKLIGLVRIKCVQPASAPWQRDRGPQPARSAPLLRSPLRPSAAPQQPPGALFHNARQRVSYGVTERLRCRFGSAVCPAPPWLGGLPWLGGGSAARLQIGPGRGGGGRRVSRNFSYNSSPHLNFFSANAPLRLCARPCLTACCRRATPACDDVCMAG